MTLVRLKLPKTNYFVETLSETTLVYSDIRYHNILEIFSVCFYSRFNGENLCLLKFTCATFIFSLLPLLVCC